MSILEKDTNTGSRADSDPAIRASRSPRQREARLVQTRVTFSDSTNDRSRRTGDHNEVLRQLATCMDDLSAELLGAPNKALSTKSEMRFGKKGSLAVAIDGPKVGAWFDHEVGEGGDPIGLICRTHNFTRQEAFDWARQWLGMPGLAKKPTNDNHAPEPDDSDEESQSNQSTAHETVFVAVLNNCEAIANTPAESYLRNRAITPPLSESIRYQPDAYRGYGALVALATDADGVPLGLQQIHLTDDGHKAPVKVVKRTRKRCDGWSDRAAVRFPGTKPLILAEGVETALSIAQSTGRETWACLGTANIGRAPVPSGDAVVIVLDGDAPNSKAEQKIRKSGAQLVLAGHSVSLAAPPEGKDFNDVLVEQGPDAVRNMIDAATPLTMPVNDLEIGSDVEVAGRVRLDLIKASGHIVHAEGEFWRYQGHHWEPIPSAELRRSVHRYDGVLYPSGEGMAPLKLSKGRIDSILNECAALCAEPVFFDERPVGINCASGFIRFASDGTPSLEIANRQHRCRHTLPGHWHSDACGSPTDGSLLSKLLAGVFQGDIDASEKVTLVSEVCGAAALGYATKVMQPRACILHGQSAENGKSQILDLARGLLPPNAISSVPAGRMGDERHIIGLVNKLLNATDELSSDAIASDRFKSVVTGEPVEGRDVYKTRVEFRPMAQNLFATNNLPAFQGGIDRGVQRRLLVIPFNRTIPEQDRIENIGRRIAAEESDLLLAWAVDGASRLIRNRNFNIPQSCKQALNDWIYGADPVLAWLDERIDVADDEVLKTSTAYANFRDWAQSEGYQRDKLPAINGFTQRVMANVKGIAKGRNKKHGRHFIGVRLRGADRIPF